MCCSLNYGLIPLSQSDAPEPTVTPIRRFTNQYSCSSRLDTLGMGILPCFGQTVGEYWILNREVSGEVNLSSCLPHGYYLVLLFPQVFSSFVIISAVLSHDHKQLHVTFLCHLNCCCFKHFLQQIQSCSWAVATVEARAYLEGNKQISVFKNNELCGLWGVLAK